MLCLCQSIPNQSPGLQLGCWRWLQVVKEEGAYANGRVTVQPLPAETYGEGAQKTVALRRLEGVLIQEEADDLLAKELEKVLGLH